MFAITQEKAHDTNDVVSDTVPIHKVPAYVIFDCGATHSFVSKKFAKKLERKTKKLVETFRVTTPMGGNIENYEIHRILKLISVIIL